MEHVDPHMDDFDRDPLIGMLRQEPLPEPAPWFAARTLARLRNERATRWYRPFVWRWALTMSCVFVIFVGAAGWHLHSRNENQKLTFAALEMVRGGEFPFTEEEDNAWPSDPL